MHLEKHKTLRWYSLLATFLTFSDFKINFKKWKETLNMSFSWCYWELYTPNSSQYNVGVNESRMRGKKTTCCWMNCSWCFWCFLLQSHTFLLTRFCSWVYLSHLNCWGRRFTKHNNMAHCWWVKGKIKSKTSRKSKIYQGSKEI